MGPTRTAIIGGSVAAGIIVLIILGIAIFEVVVKRRLRKAGQASGDDMVAESDYDPWAWRREADGQPVLGAEMAAETDGAPWNGWAERRRGDRDSGLAEMQCRGSRGAVQRS